MLTATDAFFIFGFVQKFGNRRELGGWGGPDGPEISDILNFRSAAAPDHESVAVGWHGVGTS